MSETLIETAVGQLPSDAPGAVVEFNKRALHFMFDAQRVFLGEMVTASAFKWTCLPTSLGISTLMAIMWKNVIMAAMPKNGPAVFHLARPTTNGGSHAITVPRYGTRFITPEVTPSRNEYSRPMDQKKIQLATERIPATKMFPTM